ncbi:MAG: hypothetical protein NZ824_05445 [Candidatus Thioglobus sp.]|nr:hypothetical protein [Candidatus Thioglobus sp.]
MNLSINPSYFCNFSCDFCYLTKKQLKDQTSFSLIKLNDLLKQVPHIDYVDLYGGEIGALKKDYFRLLKLVIREHYDGEINIITNLSIMNQEFFEDDISLTVSYDFEARERHEEVYNNMLMLPKPFSILILASPEVIKMNVSDMIVELNVLANLTSVEIKPYSTNQANSHDVTHKEYEEFIMEWVEHPIEKNFRFGNEDYIARSLAGDYNAFSDDHVYITPNGKFAVLEFDLNDNEFFLELDSFKEYEQWAKNEKKCLSTICKHCKYLGRCLTEHYRFVKDLDNSCSGYKGLLERYDGLEDTTRTLS